MPPVHGLYALPVWLCPSSHLGPVSGQFIRRRKVYPAEHDGGRLEVQAATDRAKGKSQRNADLRRPADVRSQINSTMIAPMMEPINPEGWKKPSWLSL